MTGRRCGSPRRLETACLDAASVRGLAGQTIRRRLDAVWHELHVNRGDPCDRDGIHRLRVATRRAIAAIDAFADLLPERGRRWFRRRLRDLRRAAGEARDLDVLAERISSESSPGSGGPARRRLAAMLARRRPEACEPVLAQRDRLTEADWPVRAERLIDRIARGGKEPAFARYCRRRLKRTVRRFFDRADHATGRRADLHRLRIDGKRLRYALEIFAPVIPDGQRAKCQKTLEALQECLGRYTDHTSAAERLRRWSARHGVAEDRRLLAWLQRSEDEAADEACRGFVSWWTRSRQRTLRRRFRRALRRKPA